MKPAGKGRRSHIEELNAKVMACIKNERISRARIEALEADVKALRGQIGQLPAGWREEKSGQLTEGVRSEGTNG